MSPPKANHAPAPDKVRITRALISVSDKTGLVALGQALAARGVEILSTGGSAQRLAEAGVPVKEVSDHTGFPEIMDGRVKTLHPRVHGGILARRDIHADAMAQHDIPPIDLVVVNLYPFEATVAQGADYANCVENIDIGGPAMIRAAAKNHDFVAIVTEPSDYEAVIDELATNDGCVTLALRRKLAQRAYARTAAYDAAISTWLAGQLGETFPPRVTLSGSLAQTLRYGENPHQQAAFYVTGDQRPGVATAIQLQGKELSYNNLNDTDAAFELVAEFEQPAVAIIKHANPCGVAQGANLLDTYRSALLCDPVSAFGGIIAVNRSLDAATAEEIAKLFAEVVIAPDADDAARALLATKKNLRVLLTKDVPNPADVGMTIKQLSGGFLLQNRELGPCQPGGADGGDQARADRTGTGRSAVRLPRRQACEVERHRLRQERRHGRRRRRPDEPRRFGPHRRHQVGGSGQDRRSGRTADQRLGGGVGRLLPVRRRSAGGGGSRRHGGDSAGRLDPRRRCDRGGG